MNHAVRDTVPLALPKGNPTSQGQTPVMIPSGYTMAILYQAERNAASNQEEQQANFAMAEQAQAKFMGNLGGDPKQSIIALVASMTAEAGASTAKGLTNAATADLCGVGANTLVTGLSLGAQGSKNFSGEDSVSGLEKQIKTTQENGKILDGKSNADLGLGNPERPLTEEESKFQNKMDEMAEKGPQGNSDYDKKVAAALKNRPEDLQRAKEANKKTVDGLSRQQQQKNTEIQQLASASQGATAIIDKAATAAASLVRAPQEAETALKTSTAEVDRSLEQTTNSTKDSLKDEARAQRQNALTSAQGIGQLAQTQTRMS